MTYKFPQIEIDKDARAWLESAYLKLKKRETVSSRRLRVELHGKIADDFDPYRVDRRLLHGGDRLTLLGIWHLDPETDLVEKTHRVISLIKEMILNNPEIRDVTSEELAVKSGIDKDEVELALRFMSDIGQFISGGYSVTAFGGITKISVDDDNVFNSFLRYKDIEQQLLANDREKTPSRSPSIAEQLGYLSRDTDFDNTPHPIFRTKIEQIDRRLCFALMPFKKEWSDRVYKQLIRENVEKLGFQCIRADNLNGPIVIEDIWTKINQCAIIIADLTDKNPNVMYEVGIVHAIGKPAILLTQDMSDIPFDFKHLRHYEYKDNVDGFRDFSINFPATFKEVYKQHYKEEI